MFNSGWSKMEKYYSLTDETPVYVASVALHPSRKWRHFTKTWNNVNWETAAKAALKHFWETHYKPASSTPSSTTVAATETSNKYHIWMQQIEEQEEEDELAQYELEGVIQGIKQGLLWWLEPTQLKRFPNLSRMAIDLLSIPAMSADPERLFSSSKITLSDRRSKMGINVLEALECLKSWIHITELNGESLVELLAKEPQNTT